MRQSILDALHAKGKRYTITCRNCPPTLLLALLFSMVGAGVPAVAFCQPVAEMPVTRLSIEKAHFTLNGKPTFLLGISFYSGLGASESIVRRDLEAMQRTGFNWLRVWATWDGFDNDVSAVEGDGRAREPYLTRLERLVAECNRRGLVVDVTLSRGGGKAPHLAKLTDLNQAVETIITRLKPYSNWYLDLANERNIGDQRHVSMEELRQLQQTARRLAPALLVTASHGGDMSREELRDYLRVAQVDFLCPHRPREAGSPAQTASQTRAYLAWMQEIGTVVPVHYQEPFRRGYSDWQPTAEDFAVDLRGAREGGAAGWCFHNGSSRKARDGRPRRSFDLRDMSLFEQLDAEERRFLDKLRTSPQLNAASPTK